jgi:hypothetical protein
MQARISSAVNDGAREFAESVAGFSNNTKQYQREYQLVKELGNLDALSPSDKKIALEYFDIFGSSDKQRRERYIGVILYSDPNAFKSLPPVSDDQEPGFHEKVFAEAYAKQLHHHQSAALKHINNESGIAEKCRVYFVAVPDADVLRERLYRAMGYVPPAVNTAMNTDAPVANKATATKKAATGPKTAAKKNSK